MLGEIFSKSRHLAGVPLDPKVAKRFYEVALVKGALASTAIEGNTLSEEEALEIFEGKSKVPPSRAYQEIEVSNVIKALSRIDDKVINGEDLKLSLTAICDLNEQVLRDTDHEPDAQPGKVREHSIVVGNYRGPPAEDCNMLLEKLSGWLDSKDFKSDDPEISFALVIACAIFCTSLHCMDPPVWRRKRANCPAIRVPYSC